MATKLTVGIIAAPEEVKFATCSELKFNFHTQTELLLPGNTYASPFPKSNVRTGSFLAISPSVEGRTGQVSRRGICAHPDPLTKGER